MDSSSLKRPLEEDPQTTKKKSTPFPEPSIDTPYSENSNTQRIVTSQLSTEPRAQHEATKQIQIAREALIKAELRGACFESKILASTICPDRTRAPIILKDLEESGRLSIDTAKQQVTIRSWPSSEGEPDERSYYKPFAELLNDIFDSFNTRFPDEPSYWRNRKVRFYPYDREMKESVDFAESLKPDLLGACNSMGPFDKQQCSWLDVEIPGEIKKSWPDLVKQATTYARCAFAASEHRYFVPVFALDQKRSKFRLLIFSRSGLVSTEEAILSQPSGIVSFVSIVVGMLNWKTELEAGYIDHQTHSHMKLNNTLYRIEDILCRRRGVRGRNTNVYRLLKEPNPLEPRRSTRLDVFGKSKELEPLLRPHPEVPRVSKQLPFSLPDDFIVKCSNSLASRPKEEEIFKLVHGYIGIVDIIGAYDADRFCAPTDAKAWNVIETGSSSGPEERLHRHIILKTCGRRLSSARSPQELGYAILHAMIGHCALFAQGGYLHRDISHGNILLLPQEEERNIPVLLRDAKIVTSRSCVAVLIDGDVAKKWGETRETASHRSGTKPFLSHRVIVQWSRRAAVVHTPVDDLESFIWVLVFVLLEKTPLRTDAEKAWWDELNHDDIKIIKGAKLEIREEFTDSSATAGLISSYLAVFAPLVNNWLKLSATYETKLKKFQNHDLNPGDLDEMKDLSVQAYKEYISTGLRHVSSLPIEWPSA